jgi:D-glycero-D-manno-heptose 1,7-bisphosphate phosphatase
MHHTKLVILGRDGTLNRYRDDHVKSPDEWLALDGALEAVSRLNHAGWHTVVATNQAGIGRGMIDMASINAVHAEMNRQLQAQGGRLDAVFFCPHTPEDCCECRKPLPGMMLDIAMRYGVELANVLMVGDTLRDLYAASAAGCEPHLVLTGRAAALAESELKRELAKLPRAHVHADLAAFAEFVLTRDHVVDSSSGSLRR